MEFANGGGNLSTVIIIKGPNMGMRYRLDNEVTTIGRATDCTIALADNEVSRVHAEIRRNKNAYTLIDRGSTNGVFVNKQRAEEEVELKRNDEIVLGSTHMLFDAGFEIQSPSYGDKWVRLASPSQETSPRTEQHFVSTEQIDRYQRGLLQLFERVGSLITSPKDSLPVVCNEVLAAAIKLAGGDRGAIWHWDPIANELVPLVAQCSQEQLAVDRPTIDRVFTKRMATIKSDVKPGSDPGVGEDTTEASESIVCAPVGTEDYCEGVIYVASAERDKFSLRELGVVMGVGGLLHLMMQHARLFDHYEAVTPGQSEMVGKSKTLQAVREEAARVAQYDTPVLITGETGTGKELLAREIHNHSPRRDGPFVAINCSAIPESLFESELFGHEKGAFTGAMRLKRGKVEIASGGTLFLDEIGEMALTMQPKLLHFLQDGLFYRVGGLRPIRSNIRIIAATNAPLARLVQDGNFRSDLLFRLNVATLTLPPLRERREDIPVLIDHFIKTFAQDMKKPVTGCSREAVDQLTRYDWPGNVRELSNSIERAVLLAAGPTLGIDDFRLASQLVRATNGRPAHTSENDTQIIGDAKMPTLAKAESDQILAALQHNDWNQQQTAEELGIHRNTLRRKIKTYDLDRLRP